MRRCNCLIGGDSGRDEDREDDEETSDPLGPLGAHEERDPERDRRRRIPEVVDQVGKQGDAAGADEDRDLSERGRGEYRQRDSDRLQPLAGSFDRVMDQAVAVAVIVGMVVVAVVRVPSVVGMRMDRLAVAVAVAAQVTIGKLHSPPSISYSGAARVRRPGAAIVPQSGTESAGFNRTQTLRLPGGAFSVVGLYGAALRTAVSRRAHARKILRDRCYPRQTVNG